MLLLILILQIYIESFLENIHKNTIILHELHDHQEINQQALKLNISRLTTHHDGNYNIDKLFMSPNEWTNKTSRHWGDRMTIVIFIGNKLIKKNWSVLLTSCICTTWCHLASCHWISQLMLKLHPLGMVHVNMSIEYYDVYCWQNLFIIPSNPFIWFPKGWDLVSQVECRD